MVAILVASIMGYLLYVKNRKENEFIKESLRQKLFILQMNPHFVFNSLNSICALIEGNSSKTIKYINNLASLFRLILSNSREEFISLKEELSATQNYLELQKINIQTEFLYSINIISETDPDLIIIPSMLIQPLVENAIKHGISKIRRVGKIEINVFKQEKNKLIQFEIKDNGQGFLKERILNINPPQNKQSLALQIIKSRLSLYGKKFKVNSRLIIGNNNANNGTICNIFLPYFVE